MGQKRASLMGYPWFKTKCPDCQSESTLMVGKLKYPPYMCKTPQDWVKYRKKYYKHTVTEVDGFYLDRCTPCAGSIYTMGRNPY